MKSYKNLWDEFISDENYYLAVKNATKHKCGKKSKYRRANYIKEHADELKDYFINYACNFKNVKHEPKDIYDGIRKKKRSIFVPTMDEQIIHHMIVNILKPIFLKGMYEHSYGSIPDRGPHLAKKRMEKWIRQDEFDYVLKMDVRKYFESIPHYILKAKLKRIIKDKKFYNILCTVIDSTDKGIPIGFYTSQWFANWYLTELDHYIKEYLHVKRYVRYMDDIVIWGHDKKTLHNIKKNIESYLKCDLGLELKHNWQIFNINYRAIDFMGFRFYKNRTTLRKTIFLKVCRKARNINKKGINIHSCRQMLSYIGWLNSSDTYNAYKKWIKTMITFQKLKRYESFWTKKHIGGIIYGLD